MNALLLLVLIAAPLLFAAAAFVAPSARTRRVCAVLAALITAVASVKLAVGGSFTLELPASWDSVPVILELLLGLLVLWISVRIRNWMIGLLALAQLVLAVIGEMLPHAPAGGPAFNVDMLAIILLLIVGLVGSAIVVYAIGYMRRHAEHAQPSSAGEGAFFFFLIGFLGVMNGLVVANDLRWLSVFWEATTLCSFFLIGYNGDEPSRRNSARALLINSFGGAAMGLACLVTVTSGRAETLQALITGGGAGGIILLPVALLCLAAFTKSAQMPFQSWLLGAMVAPTPVSALLHSATMVKAGSYLVLRLSPAFAGTTFSAIIAVVGAFTFTCASALAIGQSNAKRVLAYSTIANLGLIVACAGINTPLAYAAALTILCFHAVSKGLLFMSVGAIEQEIGSRDIEDMGGIMFKMPATTIIALIGMVSMLAPPFGMLLSKWMAIEASINSPLVLVLIVLGSAFTVLFWAKWIGRIQTVSYHEKYTIEKLPHTMIYTMGILAVTVLISGIAAVPLMPYLEPLVKGSFANTGALADHAFAPLRSVTALTQWPMLLFLGVGLAAALGALVRFKPSSVRPPFLCGENVEAPGITYNFRSLMDKSETAWSTSVYLKDILSESRMTFWANLVAAMIVLTMFGMIGAI